MSTESPTKTIIWNFTYYYVTGTRTINNDIGLSVENVAEKTRAWIKGNIAIVTSNPDIHNHVFNKTIKIWKTDVLFRENLFKGKIVFDLTVKGYKSTINFHKGIGMTFLFTIARTDDSTRTSLLDIIPAKIKYESGLIYKKWVSVSTGSVLDENDLQTCIKELYKEENVRVIVEYV